MLLGLLGDEQQAVALLQNGVAVGNDVVSVAAYHHNECFLGERNLSESLSFVVLLVHLHLSEFGLNFLRKVVKAFQSVLEYIAVL